MKTKTNISFTRITLSLLPILLISICCTSNRPSYQTVDGFAQGGTFHLVYQTPATPEAYNIPDSVALYFRQIDKSLSGYDTTSLVSRINRGENPQLDPIFIECFNISKEVYENTDGAFDISAAPLFDLWGFGFGNKGEVSQQKIDSIMTFSGMDKLSIVHDTATGASYLHKADSRMKVNFNAIAQGYTCDYICSRLEQMGIENYLLEVGGEIFCKGTNAKGNPWSIGIDKPVDGNFIPGQSIEAILEVSGKGLVTSGNYRKFYIVEGEKFSHTIDPRTGYPVKHNLLSATVMAPTAAKADAYATYLMVIGLEKGKEFISRCEDMDALMVYGEDEDLKIFATEGIKQKKLK